MVKSENRNFSLLNNVIIPRSTTVFLVVFTIISLSLFSIASAQSSSESEESVYDLSLFEVSASEDSGYSAMFPVVLSQGQAK